VKEWKVSYSNYCLGLRETARQWEITDGTTKFVAYSEEEANWLCDVLNTEIEVDLERKHIEKVYAK
jgi:hypothetical protein